MVYTSQQSPKALERARGHCSSRVLQVVLAVRPRAGEGQSISSVPPSTWPHLAGGRGQWMGHLYTRSKKDRGHITLCRILIFTTHAGETQYIPQAVMGRTWRDDVAVSQRVCFKRGSSPQTAGICGGGRSWERTGAVLTSKTRSESSCLPTVVLLFRTKKPSALFR